ncbi:ubiquitin-conjugating enzyme/RWD-like protein [Triangularia setosa]|uniref:Ubiquitin-conjugating enzyme/RWD-like protein n=1 Tax=Triangularia setosa TaxID=2587417 RepID=A0AAN7A8V1_9PEZI|nr:ubiquitin-conjugating enzyme/RWD-like protein [Podospora setosa]
MASPRSSSSSFFSPANSNINLSSSNAGGISIPPSPTIVVGSEQHTTIESAKNRLTSLPAIKRANLIAEFTALKHSPPPGIIVSLPPSPHSPDYPTLWSGVLFVRRGPYATAILRFQIWFPDDYPDSAPLVTFSTDIFHPLISPLTTYVGEESGGKGGKGIRLPPGGFGLGHGFPGWFTDGEEGGVTEGDRVGGAFVVGGTGVKGKGKGEKRKISTWEVLRYIRSTFDDERVLDEVPLEAAGNPGAWHAWRTHRRMQKEMEKQERERAEREKRKAEAEELGGDGQEGGGGGEAERAETVVSDDGRGSSVDPRTSSGSLAVPATPTSSRRPEEWNWEGVWERRVKRGIAASLSESVLFGGSGGPDEVINFLPMDEAEVEGVKQNLLRTLGAAV